MSNLLPLAQAGAAAAIGSVGIIIAGIFGLLMFLAPLGIWNRLIKIHRDQQADSKASAAAAKAQAERLDKLIALTAQLVAIQRDRP